MDQDLLSYLDARFRETAQQLAGLREEAMGQLKQMDGRLERVESKLERVEERVRHNGVEIEAVRGEVRLVAEAFIGLDEKIGTLRTDMVSEIAEVRSSIRLPFEALDRRLRLIEDRAANATRDVMSVIRERYGKGAA